MFALKTLRCSLSLSPVWCFLCACPPHPSSPTAPRAAWTPWGAATPSPNTPIQPGLCLHKPHPARLEKKTKKFIDTCSGPSSPFSGEEGAMGWGTWALPTLPSLQLVQDMSSPWGLQTQSHHPGVETGRMEKGHRGGTAACQPWGQGETHPGEPLPHPLLRCSHLGQLCSWGRPGGSPQQQQRHGTRTVGTISPSATARGHVQPVVATWVSWSPAGPPPLRQWIPWRPPRLVGSHKAT